MANIILNQTIINTKEAAADGIFLSIRVGSWWISEFFGSALH